MFTRLQLENFKAWQNTGQVHLKPVTMLLGTNSSGKSSLIQSLLLLKQTAQSSDRTIHLNLGGDEVSDLFNFGDFNSVIFQGVDGERMFSISFDFDTLGEERISKGTFECVYRQTSSGSVVVEHLLLKTGDTEFRIRRREKGAFSLYVNDESQPRQKSRLLSPERSISLPAEAIALLGLDGQTAQDLSLAIELELKRITYLGPLRRKPERDYVWNKSTPGEIGTDGHRAIDVLLASSLLKSDEKSYVIDGVSKWLAKMNVAERLEVRQTGHTRYEVVVHRGGVTANLRDVGIGISQVLPVLTVAYFAKPGSTILLEEPEIHLHPLAQSVLAEMLVTVSDERKVQFIVETHSEHLFRRMQTLIAQRKTSIDKVSMFFVESHVADAMEAGNKKPVVEASLRKLEVDEFGAVSNWPPNFFGDSVGEAREQAKARAQSMSGRRNG